MCREEEAPCPMPGRAAARREFRNGAGCEGGGRRSAAGIVTTRWDNESRTDPSRRGKVGGVIEGRTNRGDRLAVPGEPECLRRWVDQGGGGGHLAPCVVPWPVSRS